MKDRLESMRAECLSAIQDAGSSAELEAVRLEFLGKKGVLTSILKSLGTLPPEERKATGMLANTIKEDIARSLTEREAALIDEQSVIEGDFDLTEPGIPPQSGRLHPITQMCYDLNDAFHSLGFEVFTEHEITSEQYAFDNLNFPPAHPARESMDTYWLKGSEQESGAKRLCLRPHLTGASVRYLKKNGAPARFVYPGRVYRNENTDARHERAFFQYEEIGRASCRERV